MIHTASIAAIVLAATSLARPAPPPADPNSRDAWQADTRLAVPYLAKAPRCQGELDPNEWASAARIDVALSADSRNLFPRCPSWYVGWDANALYLACRTKMLKEEKLTCQAKQPGPEVLADDCAEIWLCPPDSNDIYQIAVNSQAVAFVQKRTPAGAADANVQWTFPVSAKAGEEFLDFQIALPVKELHLPPLGPGQAWRILPVRAFRCGYSLQATLPCGLERERSKEKGKDRDFLDPARYPLMTLAHKGRPAVCLASPVAALYDGKVLAEARLGASATPMKVKAHLVISQGASKLFEQEKELDLPADSNAALKIEGAPESAIDTRESASYRYDLTVTTGQWETMHTHFTYDPAENRPWLGDTVVHASEAENEYVVIDPAKGPPPAEYEFQLQAYKDLPAGHKIRLTVRRIFEPSKQTTINAVQIITPLDENGQKDGQERFFNIYGYALLRSVTYKAGVRDGPERLYIGYDKLQTEIPWASGVVRGIRRSFHPDGSVMTEVMYENGKPVGPSKSYDPNGLVTRIANYKDGLRDGPMTEYYPAPPKREVPYTKGVINGVVKEYYENGKLKSEKPYKNDLLHGVEKEYDETGAVTKTRYWLSGDTVPEGEFKEKYKPGPEPKK